MKPFTTLTGRVAAMDRPDVDTDAIIPAEYLKRIERTGFGKFLFSAWRYNLDGSENPQFVLNLPENTGASILLARRNFGCGSSREHAPWALEDYGFRVLISPKFADIFYNNCFKNGILPIVLSEEQVDDLFQRVVKHPGYQLHVDLNTCTLRDDQGLAITFTVDEFKRHCLLNGLDDIELTLKNEAKITDFESSRTG